MRVLTVLTKRGVILFLYIYILPNPQTQNSALYCSVEPITSVTISCGCCVACSTSISLLEDFVSRLNPRVLAEFVYKVFGFQFGAIFNSKAKVDEMHEIWCRYFIDECV